MYSKESHLSTIYLSTMYFTAWHSSNMMLSALYSILLFKYIWLNSSSFIQQYVNFIQLV